MDASQNKSLIDSNIKLVSI